MEVEVTEKHANEGIPGEADCCAIAMAIKETYFPEDHMHAEVNADGTIRVMMELDYEEETGATPREELYTLFPDVKQEIEITDFIATYDKSSCVDDYGKLEYMQFPYNFKFYRPEDE